MTGHNLELEVTGRVAQELGNEQPALPPHAPFELRFLLRKEPPLVLGKMHDDSKLQGNGLSAAGYVLP